ncbi:UDP-2,3-diacylglucosamine diphosphatase [bacterium]|nr:UDP-2,3-diacylglucosamine diphosphatase [bacterium]
MRLSAPGLVKHGVHWFIADAHLHPRAPEGLSKMLECLRRAGREHVAGLYFLGDLFHVWCYRTVKEEPAYGPVVEEINKLAVSGCRVMIFVGNRDFLLSRSRDFAGSVAILDRSLSVAINGDSFYLGHGDELCVNDHAYQRFRRMIRNRVTLSCLVYLPLAVRRRIAGEMTEKSKEINRAKPRETIEVPEEEYLRLAKRGHQWIVHGHTHREDHRQVQVNGSVARVQVLPAWQYDHAYGIYQPADHSFRIEIPSGG